jgi:polar amino acid transport system substrate-binding protein
VVDSILVQNFLEKHEGTKVKTFLRSALLAMVVLGLAASAWAAEKTIVNGIDAEFPPYAFIDKDGKAKGFDVDSLDWIAKKMGFTVKHQPVEWAGIIPALTSGKIDCIASGMSATPERAKVVTFTNPYKTIKQVLVVKKDASLTVDQVMKGGKKVGVQRGTTEAKWFEENKGKNGLTYEVVLYDNSPLAVQDMLAGRVEASAMDDSIAGDIAKSQPVKAIGEFGMTPEVYAYAVRKDDKALLEKLNKGLELLMKDPYWAELKHKWEIEKH